MSEAAGVASAGSSARSAKIVLRRFRSPQTVIARFVARRTWRSAVFWAMVFGAFVASKSLGFVGAYPTAQERAKVAASFANNIGITAILGRPHNISSVPAIAAWNTLGVMVVIGAIWAFLLATRYFRGEEEVGRWELLLAGQTTARRAATNVLAGLATSIVALYVVLAVVLTVVGRAHGVGFGVGGALYFAAAGVAGAAMFMAFGAFASQLMPTRARAAGLCATVFGASFLVRAMADTTSAHWLLNLTPLGWIEQLQPLAATQPLWFVAVIGLVGVFGGAAVYLAGCRDLGASIIADKDSAKPHTALLGGGLSFGFRQTRSATLAWLSATAITALFYGLLTKAAAQAFSATASAEHLINSLAHASQAAGTNAFLGIVFFLEILLVMAYAASAVGRLREDEANGTLDNLLVRSVGRGRWLAERVGLATSVVVLGGLITSAGIWAGEATQQSGVSFHPLLLAGINAMAPALLVVGIGVLALGLVPRFTTVIAYGVIAWTFLIQMVSSGLNLSHWVLDTSILHYVALAPAAAPKWGTDAIMVGVAVVLGLIGTAAFSRRDLESE